MVLIQKRRKATEPTLYDRYAAAVDAHARLVMFLTGSVMTGSERESFLAAIEECRQEVEALKSEITKIDPSFR